VRHPDLLVIRHTAEEIGFLASQIEECEAELALISLADITAEEMCDELLAVANSQHRNARGEHRRVHGRAGIVIDAAGSARYDDTPCVTQFFKRCLARKHFRGDAQLSDFASDEVTILTARVKYCDLTGRNYFFILSTMIFRAVESKACAFGIAVTAASTSGSVMTSYLAASSTLKAVL
jgi:hypothetical protein